MPKSPPRLRIYSQSFDVTKQYDLYMIKKTTNDYKNDIFIDEKDSNQNIDIEQFISSSPVSKMVGKVFTYQEIQ